MCIKNPNRPMMFANQYNNHGFPSEAVLLSSMCLSIKGDIGLVEVSGDDVPL